MYVHTGDPPYQALMRLKEPVSRDIVHTIRLSVR